MVAGLSASLAFLCFATSRVPRLRGVLRDTLGTPVRGALVVYDYSGSVPMPTPHPRHIGVHRHDGVVTTDAEGRFEIPATFHLACPTMTLQVHCVYSARLQHRMKIPSRAFAFLHANAVNLDSAVAR